MRNRGRGYTRGVLGRFLFQLSTPAGQEATNLHLGCFDKPVAGWTNTDITPHLWLARIPYGGLRLASALRIMGEERLDQHRRGIFRTVAYLNLGWRFPLPSDSVTAVFSAHVLEHLDYDVAHSVLLETYRVLKPGGIARVVVPDLDAMVEEYRPDKSDPWVDALFESRQQRGKNRHRWMYNFTSLSHLLKVSGFREVERTAYRLGACPDINLLDNRPGSLFVEAWK